MGIKHGALKILPTLKILTALKDNLSKNAKPDRG